MSDCWTLEQIVAHGGFDFALRVALDYYEEIEGWWVAILPYHLRLPVPLPNLREDGLAIATSVEARGAAA